MMQFPFTRIFKVIFVLSTIVAVTDCCSSRILLLREHTLKIVQHQHSHMHEHAHELQQQIQETAVELLNRLELERKQLEASAQEAAEQLHSETDSDPDRDPPDAQTIVENPVALDPDPPEKSESLGSSTATWLTSTPITPSETVTTSATVTHTGEPPPDQSSTSPPDSSTPTVADKESNQSKEPEIQMLPCSEAYNNSFCLNGGHCFQHPMVNNTVFHSCLCVNDYDGERCAYKSWNGDYLYTPTAQRKVRMAHIVFSFPVLIMLSSLYVLFAAVFMLRNVPDYRRKQQQLHLHKQRFFVRC
ncbi:protein gurken [Drosophila ficusphila]|uniref:protein gurken n=1 Tax=Drosophila ficusphila TaxID=30025 RepID=UPI0007E76A69|nr:protein gurken [Drosophila ficusphila]XP_043065246.1 protein gurken [Drosophila ficusphila]